MLNQMQRTGSIALALALAFVLVPQAAEAQEREEQPQDQCTAEVTSAAIPSGQAAVSVTVRLSTDVGEVTGLQAQELALASPDDLQPTEMARAEQDEPQPVEMAATGTEATVWVNTVDAASGAHDVILEGENGTCTGQIEVTGQKPGAEQGAEQGELPPSGS